MRRAIIVFLVSLFIFRIPAYAVFDPIEGGDHEGADWIITSNTTLSGVHTNVRNFIVNSGVTVTVKAYNGTKYGNLSVTAQTIDIKGTIDANGAGYTNVYPGPGNGTDACVSLQYASGGSHGGLAVGTTYAAAASATYGIFTNPNTMGSAGGKGDAACNAGGNGGGIIRLISSDSITVTGIVMANGALAGVRGGGGAGGSIYLSAPTLNGSGTIKAEGVNGNNSATGGGGGRIALHYTLANNTTLATFSVYPGNSAEYGTAVVIDDTNNDLYINTNQTWHADPAVEGTTHTYRNINFAAGLSWRLVDYYTSNSNGQGFIFNTSNFSVANASILDSNGAGYNYPFPGVGVGNSACFTNGLAGGGSHGGAGVGTTNVSGGYPYDNFLAPMQPGSAGGKGDAACNTGGAGGGAIKITATNTFTNFGTIQASGNNAGTRAGGGAGGSIYIIARDLSGTGALNAIGGGSGGSGSTGGAGGRIALHYSGSNNSSFTTNSYGQHSSENGTNVLIDDTNNDIYIKNDQIWRADPTLEGDTHTYRNFNVNTGVVLKLLSYYTSNSNGKGFTFNITNLTVATNGYLDGDGGGYNYPFPGIGVGNSACFANGLGGGASHGGAGVGTTNVSGVYPYDNFLAPVQLGSAGGKGDVTCASGGAGGGAIKINASNSVNLLGTIRTSGYAAGTRAGGGSGGSIYVVTKDLSGSGAFTSIGGASGGAGSTGGAGGRIAVYYSGSNTSTISYNAGGIHSSENGTVILVDSTNNDLYVKTSQFWRADPVLEGSVHNFRNITVSPSIALRLIGYYTNNTNGFGHIFNVNNFTLQTNAYLDLDGAGYQGNLGSGSGQGPGTLPGACTGDIVGAGAGHGGAGGNSANATGGSTYDDNKLPLLLGSSGSSGSSAAGGCTLGGAGGGALKIRASGTISLGGSIYARGLQGGYRAGNGSGGSVYLIGKSFNGTGSITTSGQNGRDTSTGGGGGRVAIYYSSIGVTLPVANVDGGNGSQVGTTYFSGFPAAPTSLTQYDSDSTTVIDNGAIGHHTTVVLKMQASAGAASTLTPQVEVRPQGVGFSNVATHTGASVAFTSTAVSAPVTVDGLADLTQYHWQARVCDVANNCSDWVSYDSNGAYDFKLVLDVLPPVTNASALTFSSPTITSGLWTSKPPIVSWTAASDDPSGSGIAGYCVALTETGIGVTGAQIDPCTDDGIIPGTAPYIVTGTSINLNEIDGLSLTTNKRYWVSIKAIDNVGNIFLGASNGSDYSNLLNFKYDSTAPTNVTSISAVSGSFSSINDFYFNWPSSGSFAASDADSGVLGYQYSVGDTASWQGTDTNSTLGLTYIPIGTSQPFFLSSSRDSAYIQVGTNTIFFRTIDNAGNYSSPATYRTAMVSYGGNAPTFPNGAAVTASIIDSTSSRPRNLFNISWPAATAYQGNNVYKYFYMVNTEPPQNYNTIKSNSAVYIGTTATSIENLELPAVHRGTNTLYVIVIDDNKDANNQLSPNYSPSNAISTTFEFNSDLPDPPQTLVAADASVKAASLWRASVAWQAPAYTGTGGLTFTVQRSADGIGWTTVTTTSGYAYLDTVPKSQKYYWRVGSSDSSDDSKDAPSYANAVTATPKGAFTTAADLSSGPSVGSITTKKAKISWSTSRTSDSKVAYGTESGKYFDEEPSNSLQSSDHTINLINLAPGTTYYYKAKWTDEDGNTGSSDEKSFTTSNPPVIKSAIVKDIGIDSAIISFTSTDANKVKLLYGPTSSFGGVENVNTATNESTYSVKLEDLNDNTKYYYQINAFDSEDNEYDGTILEFTTLPRPKVSDIRIQQVLNTAQSTLLITWKSNTDISSIITYYPSANPANSRDEVDIKMIKGDHKMLLKGLLPDTVYTLLVRGRDKMGNEAVSERYTFTTATDTRPPMVYDLNVEGTNIPAVNTTGQESSSQLVVSWTTDEPATSQVEYGEGSNTTYQQKTQEDTNLTFNHIVIISGLTPSKVYHLKAVSKDKASNLGASIDTVTITPKATDNALNLVITNLSEAFGFLGKIK